MCKEDVEGSEDPLSSVHKVRHKTRDQCAGSSINRWVTVDVFGQLLSEGVKFSDLVQGSHIFKRLTLILLIAATISIRLPGRPTSKLPMYCEM